MLESEENDIHDNVGLSDVEEDVGPKEPATELGTASELQPEGELVSPIIEEVGVDEAATEVAIRKQGEQIPKPKVEHPRSDVQVKPRKQTNNTTTAKIQRYITDASNRLQKQANQINAINKNLQSLQKQMKVGERQTVIINQIRSQVNQIQKQVLQVQKNIQKRSIVKLPSTKKMIGNKRKNKKKRNPR
jgi:hypothetical protein